jgi:lipoate-protein ligase A
MLGIARRQINLNVTGQNPDGDRVIPAADFLFESVASWRVESGTNGAEQMALDETMLRLADRPTLRVYRWAKSEVTFGYPQRWEDALAFAGGRPLTRRCTGGGFVEHGADVTISLAVPAGDPFARLSPAETYARIHAALARALGGTKLAGAEDCRPGAACFASPAQHDLMANGRKILGGAQRRSREGFLYQGSLQGAALDADVAAIFGREVIAWTPTNWKELRAELVRERYGNPAWNQRR